MMFYRILISVNKAFRTFADDLQKRIWRPFFIAGNIPEDINLE